MANRVAIFLLCVSALLIGPAAAAQADTVTKLPYANGSGGSIAVDPAGQHVFVSGGPGNSSVVVLDYSGKIVKTISGEGGAAGMALDTAAHTLYVALHDATAISEINTQTLTEAHRFSTAPYAGPSSLAIAGGKLWFSCFENQTGCLATANLDGTGLAAASGISGFSSLPALLSSGGSGNHLLALADRTSEPPGVAVYNVSSASPTLVSSMTQLNGGAGGLINDMKFDPSGAHLLVAEGAPPWIQSLTTSTLLPSTQYPTGPYPIAVAVTGDGKYVAGGVFTGTGTGNDVFVYPVGSTKPVRTWEIGTSATGNDLVPATLAFSPDSSRLFAVTDGPAGHLEFNVLLRPTVRLTATSVKLRRSASTVRYGSRVKFTVRVKGTSKGRVDLFTTTSSNIPKRVASGRLKSGRVTFSVKPKQKTTYSAQLEQGLSYASSTSNGSTVAVAPLLSVTTHPDGFTRVQGQRVSKTRLSAHVRPTLITSELLELVVQRRVNGGWRTTTTDAFPINRGIVHAFLYSSYHGLHRIQAVYAGDSAYRASKSAWHLFNTP